MKRMDVSFMSDVNCTDLKEYVKLISSVLCDGGIEFISYNFDFTNVDNNKKIICFLKWLKKFVLEFEKEKTVVFKFSTDININHISSGIIKVMKGLISNINISENNTLKNVIKKCKKLSKSKIPFLLMFNKENEDIKLDYSLYSGFKIPVSLQNFNKYDDKKILWMKKWLYDKNATDITIFSNLITNYMLDYMQNDCCHSSCLGRTLYVNKDGIISFCKYHVNESKLIKIHDAKDINSIFNNMKFMSVLKNNIDRRNICKSQCDIFMNCGGGCPLENINNEEKCSQKSFKSAFLVMAEELDNIVQLGDLRGINPCAKNCILMSIASGKLK